jgi:N-acetylmuramoyl-L-alanine amidase
MPKKISLTEFHAMLADPDIPDEKLRPYLIASTVQSTAFRPEVLPNPETVEISDEELELESAMAFGNRFCRFRRQRRFNTRIARGDKAPVLVSEGDSWFQFPFLINDVIDHLGAQDFNIWSLGAAGDTAENMVFRQPEYMAGLIRHADAVKAFLFSAAGNDIIGADITGTPVLEKLLKQSNGTEKPADLIDQAELGRRLGNLRDAYRNVIDTVRSDARFTALPIVLHGYDYAIPGAKDDQRDPIYAKPDQWLGQPMRKRNITDETTQRAIIKHLIDELYGMLDDLGQLPGIYVVDVRNTLKTKADWNDEIHGTDEGFAHVASRFRAVLDAALEESGRSPFARRRMESAGGPGTGQPLTTAPTATIVLDPGHGGSRNEGGSSWNNAVGPKGTLEKDLTLDLGLRAEKLLEARGHRVLMTRKSDRNLGLAGRAAVARNADADVFVSIHFNGWDTPTVQGTETYRHSQSNYVSRVLATRVQSAVRAATGLRDRGVKTAGFGVLRPTRHAPETAAALLEVSFITDPAEEDRLRDDAYRDRLAMALADGIETFLRETQELSPSLEAEITGGERFESLAYEGEEPLEDAAAITEGNERQQAGAAPVPSLRARAGAGPEATAKTAGIANPDQFLRGLARLAARSQRLAANHLP